MCAFYLPNVGISFLNSVIVYLPLLFLSTLYKGHLLDVCLSLWLFLRFLYFSPLKGFFVSLFLSESRVKS